MKGRVMWRHSRSVVLLVVIAMAMVGTPLAGRDVPIAQAGVAEGKDRDKNGDKAKDKNRGSDGDADHTAEGQVVGIDTLKDPPELLIGTIDGNMVVKMLKKDEIALNGVRLGDYVTVDGEKISEVLFEAQQLEVDERYAAPSTSDGTKDTNGSKDKKKH